MRALKEWASSGVAGGGLAVSSLIVMVWQAVRLLMLAIGVIFAARVLGPQGYGIFSGTVGLATTLAGFVGLGIGLLMYQRVAISPIEFSHRWRQTTAVTLVSGLVFAGVFVPLAQMVLGAMSSQIIILVAISEIVLFPQVGAAAFAFAAHEKMGWAAALPAWSATLRLGAIMFFSWLPTIHDLAHYLVYHLVASAAGSLSAWICVNCFLRPSRMPLSIKKSDLYEGIAFSAVWFTGGAMASLDKSLVLRIGGSVMTGLYASAYRFASVLAMPIDAMVMSAMPRLFRAGAGGGGHSRLVAYMVLATLSYGVVVGGVLWLAAAGLPWLLGQQFEKAVLALRWMSLFIPIYGMRQLGSQLLVAEGKKMSRAIVDVGALAVMVLLANVFIPRWGLAGAVGMLLATETLLALVIWIAVLRYERNLPI